MGGKFNPDGEMLEDTEMEDVLEDWAPVLMENDSAVCERIKSACAGSIEIWKEELAVSGVGVVESVTVTVKDELPAAVGVPVI